MYLYPSIYSYVVMLKFNAVIIQIIYFFDVIKNIHQGCTIQYHGEWIEMTTGLNMNVHCDQH